MASQPPQITQADIDAYIANYQAQQANINALNQAALAAAQQTGASNIDYYVNPIGAGEIIPGLNAGILSNLGMYNPEYQAVMQTYGSRNDQANVNDVTERSTFAVDPNADYRLVDASGKVIGTASNALEVRNLVDTANALSEEEGKKAEWKLQQTGATGGWNTVAQDDPNTIPTSIKLIGAAMAAMTAAGALQPGGFMGAGTTGAGTTAGATGAGLAEGASLASQGLASLPANLAAIQSGANAALAGAGLGAGAAGAAGTGLLSSVAPGAFEAAPIVVTAGGSNFVLPSLAALTAAGGATAAGLTGGGASSTGAGNLQTDQFGNVVDETGAIVATANGSTSLLPAVGGAAAAGTAATAATGGGGASSTSTQTGAQGGDNLTTDQFGNVVDETGAIVSTAGGGTGGTAAILGGTAALGGGAALAGGGGGASDAAISQNVQNAVDTAYTNAQTGAASDLTAAGYGGMGAGAFVAPGAGATVGGGVLGTGLTASQLATLAGLGISGVGSLLGGGGSGGAGTGTPYVSQLGAMPVFGQRTQINPNITDYERYGFGPEALFFSGGQTLNTYTPPAATTTSPGPAQQSLLNAATTPAAATPAATTPAVTTPTGPQLQGTGPFAGSQLGGGVKATPENTGMTQQRLDQLQTRYENMRSPEFFNYFKAVNDVLGNYAAKGYISNDQAKSIQARLEAAAAVPNATLQSLQLAVPMPQISDFVKPTGNTTQYGPPPQPLPQMTYTAPTQPITDPNRYINDLYKQLGAQVSQGLLNVNQARDIQGRLVANLKSATPDIQAMQNIYNAGIQQYRPLI